MINDKSLVEQKKGEKVLRVEDSLKDYHQFNGVLNIMGEVHDHTINGLNVI
jgi:hypothetical protein